MDKENRDSFIVAVVDPHIITRVPSSCASLDPPPTTRKHVALTVHYTGHGGNCKCSASAVGHK